MLRRSRCLQAFFPVFVFLAIVLGVSVSVFADEQPIIQTVPSKWIHPRNFTRPAIDDAPAPGQDFRWLLSDRQINPAVDEVFFHETRQAINAAGADACAHISVNFDPSCQSLTLHWVRVWRGLKKIERLDPARVHVGALGADVPESLLYPGKVAYLVLDDVKPGDIVDYACSIEGSNPMLAGKFAAAVPLQFQQPVGLAVTRLVWPAGRRFYIKNHLTDLKPTVLRGSNSLEYYWAATNAPAWRVEALTPSWYDPRPWVQLSEFQKWPEVKAWAIGLFNSTNAASPELARKIYEWKQIVDPEARVIAALRFVQEEIRNLGPDDAAPGLALATPSAAFARRTADNKEKALLLVAMLRSLKIDAWPVLVNSLMRQELAELQPSSTLFNHVIVQVTLNGQTYWLDPSASYERGRLATRSWPNYAWGLVLNPTSTGLTAIPPCPVQALTTVNEYVTLGKLNNRTTIKVVTVAEGADADRLRRRFATTPHDLLQREKLGEYASRYPSVHTTAPLDYSDDEDKNRIETTESYAIDGIWMHVGDELNYRARIFAVNVDDALVKADPARTMPMALPFPVHQIFHAEMALSSNLPTDPANVTYRDPAFFFQRTSSVAGAMLYVNYEYRSLADAVMPEALANYAKDVGGATDALGYTILGF